MHIVLSPLHLDRTLRRLPLRRPRRRHRRHPLRQQPLLGQQLEEPFGILPMEAFCDGSIGAALNEMVVAEDVAREKERQLAAEAKAADVAAEAAAVAAEAAAVEVAESAREDWKGVVTPVGGDVEKEVATGLRARMRRMF